MSEGWTENATKLKVGKKEARKKSRLFEELNFSVGRMEKCDKGGLGGMKKEELQTTRVVVSVPETPTEVGWVLEIDAAAALSRLYITHAVCTHKYHLSDILVLCQCSLSTSLIRFNLSWSTVG
ncbi:hypothetical protein Pmani_028610 [Petrolisthes manimaculis]|uniref:Uncharacterized protein n=1 Tax=Petrolisthes manimaculis TaxID=1843537 RepID=A0AAE1P0F2_9EUCA|nr:hypothetical protein Pmani_028610 [Petrolisthes manimaculis]